MNLFNPISKPAFSGWRQLKQVVNRPSIRLIIAMILMGIILNGLDRREVWELLKRFDLSVGLIMLSINVLLVFLFARRWQLIATALNIQVPFPLLVRTIWLGAFLGQFGPTLVIAEGTRFQMIRPYARADRIIGSQVLDRLSGQIALLLMVLLLTPYYFYRVETELISPLMLALITAPLIILSAIALYRYNRNLFRIQPREVFRILHPLESPRHYGVSILIQMSLVINFTLAAIGLNVTEPLIPFILCVPLVLSGVTLMPISVADWGTRETAALLFLGSTGLEPAVIVSTAIVFGTLNLLSALPGGLFLLENIAKSHPKTN